MFSVDYAQGRCICFNNLGITRRFEAVSDFEFSGSNLYVVYGGSLVRLYDAGTLTLKCQVHLGQVISPTGTVSCIGRDTGDVIHLIYSSNEAPRHANYVSLDPTNDEFNV